MDNGWTFIVVLVVAGFGGWFYWAQEDLATSAENYRSFHENSQFSGDSSGKNEWAVKMRKDSERIQREMMEDFRRNSESLYPSNMAWD